MHKSEVLQHVDRHVPVRVAPENIFKIKLKLAMEQLTLNPWRVGVWRGKASFLLKDECQLDRPVT